MTAQWPAETLTPAIITRHVAPRTTAGTVSASGFTQRVSAPAHAWVIEYSGIPIKNAAALAVWDAYEALLDGGATSVIVYLLGEAYALAPDGSVGVDATAGDTSITVTRAAPILAGYHFSIGERLYRVASIISAAGDDYVCNIRPPLREDVAAADPVSFTVLGCKCRLASDDEMILEINSTRVAFGKVKFVEDPSE